MAVGAGSDLTGARHVFMYWCGLLTLVTGGIESDAAATVQYDPLVARTLRSSDPVNQPSMDNVTRVRRARH